MVVRVGAVDWGALLEGGVDGGVDGEVDEALGLVFVVAEGNGLGVVVATSGGFVVGVGFADTDGVVGRVASGAGARGGVQEFPGRPLGAPGTISSGLAAEAGRGFALGSRLSTLVLSWVTSSSRPWRRFPSLTPCRVLLTSASWEWAWSH